MKNTLIALVVLLAACQPAQKEETDSTDTSNEQVAEQTTDFPDLLKKALEAHGGIDTWKKQATLTYDLSSTGKEGSETQTINLHNRKVLIERDTVKVGFDGDNVWVTPDLEAFGGKSARFYHNLYFYFFGIPFLLGDPGINYEDLGERTIGNNTYRALKVSYETGVGDSDEDLYIAHFNPETYKLELLLYTVTYYSGERHENYNALLYPEWKTVNGLLVPVKFVGHKFENDSIGSVRYDASFSNISFSESAPDESLFEMPQGAEIDSLKK